MVFLNNYGCVVYRKQAWPTLQQLYSVCSLVSFYSSYFLEGWTDDFGTTEIDSNNSTEKNITGNFTLSPALVHG